MIIPLKYNLEVETLNYNDTLKLKANIHLQDNEGNENGFDKTTILRISQNNVLIIIKVDWCHYSTANAIFETLIVPETDNLIFGARFFWGILNLKNLQIIRQESCEEFWSVDRHENSIVVITELEAFALNLNGSMIDQVSIDPPFESKIFENKIVFECPIFGIQTLNLKK